MEIKHEKYIDNIPKHALRIEKKVDKYRDIGNITFQIVSMKQHDYSDTLYDDTEDIEQYIQEELDYNSERIKSMDDKYERMRLINDLTRDVVSQHQRDKEFRLTIFGVTSESESVAVNVTGFKPYFFIKLPENVKWTQSKFQLLLQEMESKAYMWKRINICGYASGLNMHESKVVHRHELYGFTNKKLFQFGKLVFNSQTSMNAYRTILKYAFKTFNGEKYPQYESNIDPMLRLLHTRDLDACGWMNAKFQTLPSCEDEFHSTCQFECTADYRGLSKVESEEYAPFVLASYDIEAWSYHGDFPIPKKKYEKLMYDLNNTIMLNHMKMNVNGRSDIREYISQKIKTLEYYETLLRLAFDDTIPICQDDNEPIYEISKVFTKCDVRPEEKTISQVSKITHPMFLEYIQVQENIRTKVWKTIKDTTEKNQKKSEIMQQKTSLYTRIHDIFSGTFPPVEGDIVTQIGTVVRRFQDPNVLLRHIICLKETSDLPSDAIVEWYDTEEEVILAWFRLIKRLDPDEIDGYNIFGFDEKFLWERAEELGITHKLHRSRMKSMRSYLYEKKLNSAGLGDNTLYYIISEGRVLIDLMKVIQRDHNLGNYRLDSVAETFMRGNVTSLTYNEAENMTIIGTSDTGFLKEGNFVSFVINDGVYEDRFVCSETEKDKFNIYRLIENKEIIVHGKMAIVNFFDVKVAWCEVKDDISPQEIFDKQLQGPTERAEIAKYCIQDCELCARLCKKLDVIPANISMGNVCSVPLEYIFMRGQGIKILSLIGKFCRKQNTLIPVLPKKDKEPYEGAIVLDAHRGIYTDDMVSVLDFNSLYPSCMIAENLSHDTIILDPRYANLPGREYVDITYTVYEMKSVASAKSKKKKKPEKVAVGEETRRFIQPPKQADGSVAISDRGILCQILMALLKARKDTRAKIKETNDPFKKKLYDLLQLAFKVTANSIYGQMGASTSPVFMKPIAECTTASGRETLLLAKKEVEELIPGTKTVYGDTDSNFYMYPRHLMVNEDGSPMTKLQEINKNIELSIMAGKHVSSKLKFPHNLEFEKVIWPFILFSKKRYVGRYYMNPKGHKSLLEYIVKSMGIALKRRDNALIVKHIYGGCVKIILNEQNIEKAKNFVRTEVEKVLNGEFPMDKFIISKTLKGFYKNPDGVAHKVLADRIGIRDPGSKPKSNDRIPYAYIELPPARKGEKVLQGDKIELPSYIKENHLKLDYLHYITNQIQKPVSQIFELEYSELLGCKNDIKIATELVTRELFARTINQENLKRKGYSSMDRFLSSSSSATNEIRRARDFESFKKQTLEKFRRKKARLDTNKGKMQMNMNSYFQCQPIEKPQTQPPKLPAFVKPSSVKRKKTQATMSSFFQKKKRED